MRTNEAVHFMKRLILAMMVLTSTCSAFAQGTFVYDQQSATNGFGQAGADIQTSQPVGQSFTPASAFIGFATLQFSDTVVNNGIGSTVFVNLREDSITGNVLTASSPVFMRDSYVGTTDFIFPSNVPITPGSTYFLVPVLQSGDDTSIHADFYNYPGGTAYTFGQPNPGGLDFWFREGYIVPEPSVACLSLAGVAVAVWFRRRKSPVQ